MAREPPFAVLDSNVYVRIWTDRAWAAVALEAMRPFIVRVSSVVLSELRRGARTPAAVRRIEQLRSAATEVWTPDDDCWWKSAVVLADIGARLGWDAAGKRERQNDALIALTARRHGAAVVTADRDFEPIATAVPGLRVVRF